MPLQCRQSMVTIEEEDDNSNNMLICAADFPSEYVNMQHPDDYTLQDAPIQPSFTVNQRQGRARLIFRISWKTGNKYLPMSFIVNTGAVQPIYFGTVAMSQMEAHRLLFLDNAGSDIVKLHRPACECSIHYRETPKVYDPINIIGLRFLLRFGIVMDGSTFRFNEHFLYF